MIVFHNILDILAKRGWSTYRLIKEKQLGNGTITRLRKHQSITTETIDKICELCQCQPEDLMHYEKENKE